MPNSQKIKPIVLAVVKLHLSESISQSVKIHNLQNSIVTYLKMPKFSNEQFFIDEISVYKI